MREDTINSESEMCCSTNDEEYDIAEYEKIEHWECYWYVGMLLDLIFNISSFLIASDDKQKKMSRA